MGHALRYALISMSDIERLPTEALGGCKDSSSRVHILDTLAVAAVKKAAQAVAVRTCEAFNAHRSGLMTIEKNRFD